MRARTIVKARRDREVTHRRPIPMMMPPLGASRATDGLRGLQRVGAIFDRPPRKGIRGLAPASNLAGLMEREKLRRGGSEDFVSHVLPWISLRRAGSEPRPERNQPLALAILASARVKGNLYSEVSAVNLPSHGGCGGGDALFGLGAAVQITDAGEPLAACELFTVLDQKKRDVLITQRKIFHRSLASLQKATMAAVACPSLMTTSPLSIFRPVFGRAAWERA
ncbi:hypothetical protein ABIB42_002234 [Massilia sp. UYP32]